jgi:hypothetical protein
MLSSRTCGAVPPFNREVLARPAYFQGRVTGTNAQLNIVPGLPGFEISDESMQWLKLHREAGTR